MCCTCCSSTHIAAFAIPFQLVVLAKSLSHCMTYQLLSAHLLRCIGYVTYHTHEMQLMHEMQLPTLMSVHNASPYFSGTVAVPVAIG
jgi:hypothetical protein